ncbi:hypothetical protein C7M61_002945 [Candidozyma pseudohaemuli]|uniref:Cytochrome b-c1 complex subunit 6, mitochondrial n=1 Tax=Candidozyma pseudohaemuli TaxID=418784 RepID=A0A2P7YQY7_9ASCO|nr:hypothetical protein C7M61_002945 [[Candida] pseudohaemulonii]PSK38382.1 hypothetical protein C7M61_002945 [[Candida] pseudohaemulonii]
MSFFRDLIEQAFPVAYAAEPEEEVPVDAEEESQEESQEETQEEDAGEAAEDAAEEAPESDDAEEEEDEDEDEDEDDEDDEEEVTDPFDDLREECAKTASCVPYVHHFDHCVERVQKEQEEEDYAHKHYKEDCVEEFFHLQHCINDCAAPRLFYKLK